MAVEWFATLVIRGLARALVKVTVVALRDFFVAHRSKWIWCVDSRPGRTLGRVCVQLASQKLKVYGRDALAGVQHEPDQIDQAVKLSVQCSTQ